MPSRTAAIRQVLVVGLLTVLAAGCRFPDMCDLYPVPDAQAAVNSAASVQQPRCSLSVRYQGRTYNPTPGALVTEVGDPIDGVTLRACNDVSAKGDEPRRDGRQPVTAFAFGTYCTTDVIAVELAQGDQLTVYTATE
jgi:hypothetical protein